MKRRNIQLLAAARQGDPDACCEIGRRYLHGSDGFPRDQRTALDYLTGPAAGDSPKASLILVEGMTLEEIVLTENEAILRHAAASGSKIGQLKMAAWLLIQRGNADESRAWLQVAAVGGNVVALHSLAALDRDGSEKISAEILTAHCGQGHADVVRLNTIAAKHALARNELSNAMRCLRAVIGSGSPLTDELADITIAVIDLADRSRLPLVALCTAWIESCLESGCDRGKRNASYLLGRALCGISSGPLAPHHLTERSNIRKGSALLLRAADGGIDEAWLHLYRLHAEPRSSVANLPMARVFLEKAASRGDREAQRMLGALLMSECTDLSKAECAIGWLYRATRAGDLEAAALLDSLVVRPIGSDTDASAMIEEMSHREPLLAARLQLARHFGLTKREALMVNPVAGQRPWGLVVDRNPYIVQSRLCAPRAIPSPSEVALSVLQRAASMYQPLRQEASVVDHDWRHRARQMRKALDRHRIVESLFFANIPSSTLEAMRGGPKWAARCRRELVAALEPVDASHRCDSPKLPLNLPEHLARKDKACVTRLSTAHKAPA